MNPTPEAHSEDRVSIPPLRAPTALIDARHPLRSVVRLIAWVAIAALIVLACGGAMRGCERWAERPNLAERASTPTTPHASATPSRDAPPRARPTPPVRPVKPRPARPAKPTVKRPPASSRPSVARPAGTPVHPSPARPKPSTGRPSTTPQAPQPPVVLEVPDPPKPTTPTPPLPDGGTQDGSGSMPPATTGGAGGSSAHNCDPRNESC